MIIRICDCHQLLMQEVHDEIEALLRLSLGSWTSRIQKATLHIKHREGHMNGLAILCRIEAVLPRSGRYTVRSLGPDIRTAVRGAVLRLIGHLKVLSCHDRPRDSTPQRSLPAQL